jgi:hypothetical protein
MPKAEIHPTWYPDAKVICNGEVVMTTGSTSPELHVDVWSASCASTAWAVPPLPMLARRRPPRPRPDRLHPDGCCASGAVITESRMLQGIRLFAAHRFLAVPFLHGCLLPE